MSWEGSTCRTKGYFNHCYRALEFKVECTRVWFRNTCVKSVLKFYLRLFSESSHVEVESQTFGRAVPSVY